MATMATMAFVKIHSLTSAKGVKLNGTTGKLGTWDGNLNRYQVFVAGSEYMIKLENLYSVNDKWVGEVRRSPMRKSIDHMTSKFDAPGLYPCGIEDLQVLPRHRGGPGTNRQQLQSWWGDNVFRYIRERMQQQRNHSGNSNWDMDRAIQQGDLWLAGLCSDGGKSTQQHSSPTYPDGTWIMVWPTIVFPCYSCSDRRWSYWSYCQGLALMDGASAWEVNPDALEIYGPYETTVEPIEIPSTVVIEELPSDSEAEEEWVRIERAR